MEQQIKQLLGKLKLLGYCALEIKAMIQEAIGHCDLDLTNSQLCRDTVAVLEKYERLGSQFSYSYSK